MSEHTAGPWFAGPLQPDTDYGAPGEVSVGTFDIAERFRDRKDYNDHYEDAICHVHGGNFDAEANARLIAAAPELLDTLEHVSRLDPSDCYRIGFAAVFEEMQDRARAAIAKATASATREKA